MKRGVRARRNCGTYPTASRISSTRLISLLGNKREVVGFHPQFRIIRRSHPLFRGRRAAEVHCGTLSTWMRKPSEACSAKHSAPQWNADAMTSRHPRTTSLGLGSPLPSDKPAGEVRQCMALELAVCPKCFVRRDLERDVARQYLRESLCTAPCEYLRMVWFSSPQTPEAAPRRTTRTTSRGKTVNLASS